MLYGAIDGNFRNETFCPVVLGINILQGYGLPGVLVLQVAHGRIPCGYFCGGFVPYFRLLEFLQGRV